MGREGVTRGLVTGDGGRGVAGGRLLRNQLSRAFCTSVVYDDA